MVKPYSQLKIEKTYAVQTNIYCRASSPSRQRDNKATLRTRKEYISQIT